MGRLNIFLIIGGLIAAYFGFSALRGISAMKSEHEDVDWFGASQLYFKSFFKGRPRVDSKAAETYHAKGLGGQPIFYNEADYSFGRFVSMYRSDEDLADERVVHNNLYRVRYLKDVRYFLFFKGSEEAVTPCVFRPGIDVISLSPGEAAGVPSEGLVILRRSLCGTRLATGHGERYRSLLLAEQGKSKMFSDLLYMVQTKQRLAHMDPSSKEYVDEIVEMLKRTKKIHDAAGGRERGDGLGGFGSPYSQEMYGGEDPSFSGGGGGDDGLWKLG